MGEYATRRSDGEEIKIGTCESMYYLRADQRQEVEHLSGNVNPNGEDAYSLRFRFPWPNEDGQPPGSIGHPDYNKAVAVPGYPAATGIEHHPVQFVAQAGYNVCLPCPEGPPAAHGLRVARNGFRGATLLFGQKLLRDGRLVPVLRCGGCGSAWREEDRHEIEAIAAAFRSEADRRERDGQYHGTGKTDRVFWDAIADRILTGARIAETVSA